MLFSIMLLCTHMWVVVAAVALVVGTLCTKVRGFMLIMLSVGSNFTTGLIGVSAGYKLDSNSCSSSESLTVIRGKYFMSVGDVELLVCSWCVV